MTFIHLVPSPAALMWMEIRMTFGMRFPVGAGNDEEMAGRVGHDERSGDSRQGRTRGGGATEGRGDARSKPGMTIV